MTAEEQHLAALLRETTAADATRIAAAEAQLASASDQPGFAAALLGCVSRAAPGAGRGSRRGPFLAQRPRRFGDFHFK